MSSQTPWFQYGLYRIVLTPDSRNFVEFSLWKSAQDGTDSWSPVTSNDVLTCEYLTDLLTVTVIAMEWIENNCVDIQSPAGMHLYYQFKEPVNERTLPGDASGSNQALAG